MIQIPFLLTECLFALGWLLLRAAVWLRQKRIDWKREAMLLLMYVNLAVILRFAFFPMARVDGRVQPLLFDASAVRPFRLPCRRRRPSSPRGRGSLGVVLERRPQGAVSHEVRRRGQ